MTKRYQVTGRYPATRPMQAGTIVELAEEAARYHVLDGALTPVESVAETGLKPASPAVPPLRPKRRGRR